MISRRNFVSQTAQVLGLSWLGSSIQSCDAPASFPGKIVGQNSVLGHRLRTMDFGPVTEIVKTDVVVVGGGVAGLSAARYLNKHARDFLLLELGDDAGGNAAGGSNRVSAFPWGAHYLPLPSDRDPELIAFLEDAGVITGWQHGLPVYNEYDLCFDPKERLFINYYWQEGIIPKEGVPKKDRDEIERFLMVMNDFKHLKGSDGRDAFAIPLVNSSQDKKLLALDTISAEHFLRENNFKSPYLKWYVNYCCADDYGTSCAHTSAWAMIHYFASRQGRAANATADAVLTWPEGNYRLINHLKKPIEDKIQTQGLVYKVELCKHGVEVFYFDARNNVSKKIVCNASILATPQFVNQRLLQNHSHTIDYSQFQYAPWMVANITLDGTLDERRGEKLCWDNVIYGSDALGYINARQQQIGSHQPVQVITYYQPQLTDDVSLARKQTYQRSFERWKTAILADLKKPHPGIEKRIQEMNIWLWGHGMIKPSPGFIWGEDKKAAAASLDGRIYFAHSDLSGISIFEEAFFQGCKAAKAVLGHGSV